MRKSICIAAALATVALVGCQKELAPVVGTEQGKANLELRPELGSVTLTVGDPETRAQAGGNGGYNWVFESGDQVGAMLVDEVDQNIQLSGSSKAGGLGDIVGPWKYADYVKGETKWNSNFTASYLFKNTYKVHRGLNNVVTDDRENTNTKVLNDAEEFYVINENSKQIWTNYPYTTTNGKSFTTPATLVEGHYVFYAPYNAGNGTRGPLVATLPMIQDVSTPSKAVADFYKSGTPVLASSEYLSASQTSSVETSPQPIYAYPQFTIANNYEGYLFDGTTSAAANANFLSTVPQAKTYTMKVKQVEIYAGNSAKLAYQLELDPQSMFKNKATWDKKSNVYKSATTSSVMNTMTPKYAEDKFGLFTLPETIYPDNAYKFRGIVENTDNPKKDPHRIVLTFGAGKELKNGETYSFNVVMPAEDYTADGLFARVLVEIDGVDYYIQDNTEKAIARLATSAKYEGFAVISSPMSEPSDYKFVDRGSHNNKDVILVRGERYPTVEVNDDRSALKEFAGELLTINLTGGLNQVAIAKATDKNSQGIKTNEDFYKYLNTYVNKGQEDQAEVSETEWSVEAELTSKEFFFDKNECSVVINADFVSRVSAELGKTTLKLKTNLPIANDVVVSGAGPYTFKANGKSLTIDYTNVTLGTNGRSLVNGINVVTSATELARSNANVTGAVVFLNGGSPVIKNAAGISGIVVAETAKLTVDVATNAWIVAEEDASVVTVTNKGTLSNSLNDIAFVENTGKSAITGTFGVVNYTVAGLNINTIPYESRINRLTIDDKTSGVNTMEVTITQEMIDKALGKLTDGVDIVLSTRVAKLSSPASVTLTNVTFVGYKVSVQNNHEWRTDSDETIYIYFDKRISSNTFFKNVVNGARVTFLPWD